MKKHKVIIIGAGPSGIGNACCLKQANIDCLVLEKKEIGESFSQWPKEMKMITPSFPSNAFGQMDLNSVCFGTSPAFTFSKEHLSGKEYSVYLKAIANYFQLNIKTGVEVENVTKEKDGWVVETNSEKYFAKYIIYATGETQNPQIENIVGAENCVHSFSVKDYSKLKGESFVVVGGYESAIQSALSLVENGKKVTLVSNEKIDNGSTSDPSKVLSPFTFEKYQKLKENKLYKEIISTVKSVEKTGNGYEVVYENGKIETKEKPICATGFSLLKKPVEKYLTYRQQDGLPKLDENTDEFFGHKNIYLSGPSVRHDGHIFCFIYKFRQRFGVIAEDILKKEKYSKENIDFLVKSWKESGLYLKDLTNCADECVC